jgi:hypothetical protein
LRCQALLQIPSGHYLRDLADAGLITLIGRQRRRNFEACIYQASADAYIPSPELFGDLAHCEPGDPRDPATLVAFCALTLRTIAELAPAKGAQDTLTFPALTLHAGLCFSSAESLADFSEELRQELVRLVAKYHASEGGPRYCVALTAHAVPHATAESAHEALASKGHPDL